MPWQPPSVGSSSLLFSQATVTAASATAQTNGPTLTFQPSANYRIIFGVSNASASGDAVAVQLVWSFQGIVFGIDTFYIMGSSSANPHFVQIQGPCAGPTLNINVVGGYTTNSPKFQYNVFQFIGSTFPGTTCKSLYLSIAAGSTSLITQYQTFTAPVFPIASSVTLADMSSNSFGLAFTVPANTTDTFALPMWNGPVTCSGQSNSLTGNASLIFLAASQAHFSPQLEGQVANVPANANGVFNASFQFPRAQCVVNVINGAAAAEVIQFFCSGGSAT